MTNGEIFEEQLVRDIRDAREVLGQRGVLYTRYDERETVRLARLFIEEGWGREDAFDYGATIALGARRVPPQPSPY